MVLDLRVVEQVVVAAGINTESVLGLYCGGTNRRAQRQGDQKKCFFHDCFCSTKSWCIKKGEEQSEGPREELERWLKKRRKRLTPAPVAFFSRFRAKCPKRRVQCEAPAKVSFVPRKRLLLSSGHASARNFQSTLSSASPQHAPRTPQQVPTDSNRFASLF